MSGLRTILAAAAGLAVTVAPVLAQTAPMPPPAPVPATTPKVGDSPASVAELIDAVDLCRRAAQPRAFFDYRLLRDSGYGVGSRKWEQREGQERGEVVWGFGKGNAAMFVRHGATSVNCKVAAFVNTPNVADTLRGEILTRNWAKTFEEGTPANIQEEMRKKNPTNDFKRILVGANHIYGIDSNKTVDGRDTISITVAAIGAGQ